MGQKRKNPPGRPRLGRARHTYRVAVEQAVDDRIAAFGSEAGLPTGTYAERIIALAHGFDSPFLRPLPFDLPAAVEADELREFVEHVEPEQCTPMVPGVPSRFRLIRIDQALADRINRWCEQHGVDYGPYVRSILRRAAGFNTAESLRPQHVQGELIHVDGGRAVAS